MHNPTHPFRRILCVCVLLAINCLNASRVSGHDGVDDQITRLTSQIAANATAADLFVRRAELYRQSRRWNDALADLDRAASLDPSLSGIDPVRATVMLDAGRLKDAIVSASRVLEHQPDHVGALIVRARARTALHQYREADVDFVRALTRRPLPELYIERARALSASGAVGFEPAIRALDEGVARLGPIVTLELEAIDLSVRMKRYDAALARIDRVAAQTARKEDWLARRGAVLERSQRFIEARDAYQAALTAIAALPFWTQATAATTNLRQHLQNDVLRLTRQLTSATQDH
jgi:tetratricopeptide (TPR) repeat protein